jgi:hypothetical protein
MPLAPFFVTEPKEPAMDLNHQYAAHQQAVMRAGAEPVDGERCVHLGLAASIAAGISQHQAKLGAAAAGAWSLASVRAPDTACGA